MTNIRNHLSLTRKTKYLGLEPPFLIRITITHFFHFYFSNILKIIIEFYIFNLKI